MTQADQIRQYVIAHYIQPARTAGKKLVTIQADTIHTEMHLDNRMPNVCSSLDAQKFYDQAAVTLVKGYPLPAESYYRISRGSDPRAGSRRLAGWAR